MKKKNPPGISLKGGLMLIEAAYSDLLIDTPVPGLGNSRYRSC